MGEVVSSSLQHDVCVITVDNPPVNALSQAVRAGLLAAVTAAEANPAVTVIVLTCAGRTFIAGADIREFGKPPQAPDLPEVIAAFESATKPTVAAMFGSALGGGLEVALGCHIRVANTETVCGFPEVKLGIIPGSGGTQSLPRLIGVDASLEMILNGTPVTATRALELGLIDGCAEELGGPALLALAIGLARQAVSESRPLRRLSREQFSGSPDDAAAFERHANKIARKPAFAAPPLALEAVRAATTMPFDDGRPFERSLFLKLRASEQAAALRHAFFAERAASKVPGLDRSVKALTVKSVGVIGAGTMGAGIATCFAQTGMQVVLIDRDDEAVSRGLATVEKNFVAKTKRGQLTAEQAAVCSGRVGGSQRYEDLADVDLVVEAVFEDMGLKQEVFQQLTKVCRANAVLATNTSTLDINVIAAASDRPGQVVGMHFFSPAHIMKLLEVVQGNETSPEVMATVMKVGAQLGKVTVPVGVCHGFVGNRMLYPYRREALFLVEEGASPAQVDGVLTRFGMPMGPFAMSDLAGLDIGYRVRQAEGKPANERYSGTVADRLVEMGRLGQKSGAGFYSYTPGDRTAHPDPAVTALVAEVSAEQGISQRQIDDEEILERCLYALINEGAKVLGEGVAHRGGDIDTVWMHGYGFPSYRGGPLYYADKVGLVNVLSKIQSFRSVHGELWEPAPLLVERAGNSMGLSEQ